MITVTTLAEELLDLLAEEDPLNDLMQGYAGYDDRLGDLGEVILASQRSPRGW